MLQRFSKNKPFLNQGFVPFVSVVVTFSPQGSAFVITYSQKPPMRLPCVLAEPTLMQKSPTNEGFPFYCQAIYFFNDTIVLTPTGKPVALKNMFSKFTRPFSSLFTVGLKPSMWSLGCSSFLPAIFLNLRKM